MRIKIIRSSYVFFRQYLELFAGTSRSGATPIYVSLVTWLAKTYIYLKYVVIDRNRHAEQRRDWRFLVRMHGSCTAKSALTHKCMCCAGHGCLDEHIIIIHHPVAFMHMAAHSAQLLYVSLN